MQKVKTKIFLCLLLAFILAIGIYSIILFNSTWKDNPKEISCKSSGGEWQADDPWNLVLGNRFIGDNDYLNCNCGLFGHSGLKDKDPNKPTCIFYKEPWINNEKECKAAGFYYIETFPGSEYSICLCTFDQRENTTANCLLDLAWRDYLNEHEKTTFLSSDLILHIISFGIIYFMSLILIIILFYLMGKIEAKNRKKAIFVFVAFALLIGVNFIVMNIVKVPYTDNENYSESEKITADKSETRIALYSMEFIGVGQAPIAGGGTARGDYYRIKNLEAQHLCFPYKAAIMDGNQFECVDQEEQKICLWGNEEKIVSIIALPECRDKLASENKDIMSKRYLIKPVFTNLPEVTVSEKEDTYMLVNKTMTVTKYETLWQALVKNII